MDSLYSLGAVLAIQTVPVSFRKLCTAIYLTQTKQKDKWYRYNISKGMVMSDALEQDLFCLESAGAISRSYNSDTNMLLIDTSGRVKRRHAHSSAINSFIDSLTTLLEENEPTLEATATLVYFQQENLGVPEKNLNWFKQIPTANRTRAATLSESITVGDELPDSI